MVIRVARQICRFSKSAKKCTSMCRSRWYSSSTGNSKSDSEKFKAGPQPHVSDFEMFNVDAEQTLVYGHFTGGFSINGDKVNGSLMLFPRSFFEWTVAETSKITTESLTLLWTHNPKPDVLLLGTGSVLEQPDAEVIDSIRAEGISVDVMTTVAAASTFNILNMEQRNVATALIALKE